MKVEISVKTPADMFTRCGGNMKQCCSTSCGFVMRPFNSVRPLRRTSLRWRMIWQRKKRPLRCEAPPCRMCSFPGTTAVECGELCCMSGDTKDLDIGNDESFLVKGLCMEAQELL